MLRITVAIAFTMLLPFAVQASGEAPHWDYEGADGPEHWGELTQEFDICSRGKNQSPIDLVADVDAELPELIFDYAHPNIVTEVNTGHAIQESVQPGNSVRLLGKSYELKQFHFHSPSEHTVNGNHYPMEVHLVHQSEAGAYLVVGLMFEEGPRNAAMDQLPSFRAERGEDPRSEPFDYNELVTNRTQYFLYNGSLTTPPCTEGVSWIVMQQPILASPEQIQHYHDLLGFDNNRPVQPRNARIVLE